MKGGSGRNPPQVFGSLPFPVGDRAASSGLGVDGTIGSAHHVEHLTRIISKDAVSPVIESSVLIEETEEQPHADGLHPKHHEQQPDRGQQQLTHHPDDLFVIAGEIIEFKVAQKKKIRFAQIKKEKTCLK